jgi:hypothetical protein
MSSIIRSIAIEKLSNQVLLSELAILHKDIHIRKEAVNKLEDQDLLHKIAQNDSNIDVQLAATIKLTDHSAKTENLIRLFHCSYETCDRHFYNNYNFDYKPQIAKQLKELYQHYELTQSSKAKILNLTGQLISKHEDFECRQVCPWPEVYHSDMSAQYFFL